ncbi:hypothetical protein WH47_04768 [Habropoda laboriosa]|uniref:Fanconi Anaemia group E protein C-terminal domain-containing protein n=1 Tax=Habropoda laboriosa TaxID=597456 RepID=A0A0L7QXN3_9HYME|nr:PREDICTED: uncharacterized protein LOC108574126 [Habropoda laboriosa]KOC63319.1 hypothetical protein WH47_04768 [Habropoda laboriosa]
MNHTDILKDYALSRYTMERLKVIKEKLNEDLIKADSLWQIITGKEEETQINMEDTLNESNKDCYDILFKTADQFSSTQFYFTQLDKHFNKDTKQEHVPNLDITECLYEGLESSNGKLDVHHLENLTDTELVEVVCNLEKKLSILGVYNLCCSMNNMTLEQRIKYAAIFHSYLLLPKIIALEEPSRLLLSVVTECALKFPDDIQKLIFVPLLNVDLNDTTIINAIVNAFEPKRRIVLIVDYLSNVKDLKSWHLSFLYNLISVKTDIATNDKIIELLYAKALDFAKDKNFGKLVLSFIKLNINFSEEQKCLLGEIANTNETFFKRPIQNILKAM